MSLGPNGVNRVCSLRKIMMRLHAKNFCASSARFALSFVRQPNGPKCIQIVQNTPKYEFRVQWGGSGAFLREIPTRLLGTHFCTNLARFALSFVTQPNCPKCILIVWNAQKHEVRVQMLWIGCFVVKSYEMTSWHKLFPHFGSFWTEFWKASKRYQMHPNSMKGTKT